MITDNIKNIIKTHSGAEIDITPYKKVQEAFFSARTKRFLAIFAVVFVIMASIYKFVLPNFIHPEMVEKILQSSINQGYVLDLKNLKTDLSWDLALVLDADEISLKNSQKSIFYSQKAHIKVPLLMLLFQKFDNSQFYSNYVDAYLARDADGVLNIKKAFKFKKSSTDIAKFRVAIKDYDITFEDFGQKPIVFNGHSLDLCNLKLYRVKTFGTIAFPDGERTILNINFVSKKPFSKGEFVLKGDVENFDFKKFERYLKEFVPEITKAQGVIRGEFDIDAYGREKLTNNLKLSLNTNNVYISTKKYLHFFEIADDAQIFAEGKYFRHKLNLKKARVISRDYNFELSGKIKDIDRKVKNIDVKVKTKNSNAKKLLGLVPKAVTIKHDAVNKAVKHNVDAILNCDLRVRGRTNAAKYAGNINVKQFVIDGDISNSKSEIDLSFKRRKITIRGLVFDSKGGLVEVIGTSLLGRVPKMDLDFISNKFDFTEFRKNVIVIADILEFGTGILPETQVNGTGKINVCIMGSGKNANVNGYLQAYNTTLKYSKLAKPVFVKFADLRIKKRNILFKDLEAFIDSHKLLVNGFLSLDNETDATITAQNFPLPLGVFLLGNSELFEKAHKGVSKIETSGGNINFNVRLLSNSFNNIKPYGSIFLLKNSLKFTDFSPVISDIIGEIKIDGFDYIAENVTAKALNSPISMKANVIKNKIDATINAPSVDFAQLVKGVLASRASLKLVPLFNQVKNPSGTLPAVLTLNGDMSSDFFDKVECDKVAVKFYYGDFLAPVVVHSGKFSSTKDELCADKINFDILNAKGVVDGKIKNLSQKPVYALNLDVLNIDKTAFEALKKCNFSSDIKKILLSIGDFSGSAVAHVKINNVIKGKVSFNNIAFKYLPAALPVRVKNGDLLVDGYKISLPNSQVQVGASKFKLSAAFEKGNSFYADLSGNLTPEELDKYVNKILLHPLNLKQSAPVKLKIVKDKTSDIKIICGMFLNPENAISYKGISIGDGENSYVLGGSFWTRKNIWHFDNLGVCQYPNRVLAALGFANPVSAKNFLQVSGWLNKNSLEENLHVYSRDFININILNEVLSQKMNSKLFHSGSIKGDISLRGRMDFPKILGKAELRAVRLAPVKVDIPSLKLDFTNDSIYLQEGLLRLADMEFRVDGVAENIIEMPYVFKNITVDSDYVNIDEVAKVFAGSSTGRGSLPLFVIKNGTMSAKKMIINNLSTDDASADFSFTPDWVMTLDKFSFSTAGGEVLGDMTFDFSNYESKTFMKFKNLKANAVATTLLQMPNEIYGLLNGEAKFVTKGISQTDLIKNSNGNIKFRITSGRLVRMGSLEYLLMAAEVMKSGLTGLCINNVCTLLSPHKTGDFDTLNVDFKVKNGVLFTDDLISRGKNLNIYLAGNFDMTTNYSDFTILGRVSKSAMSILGPIGDLSISKLINVIPGKDDSGNSVLNNLSKFPGVDFNDKTYRRFVVNIEGDLYDTKSVKNFKWID